MPVAQGARRRRRPAQRQPRRNRDGGGDDHDEHRREPLGDATEPGEQRVVVLTRQRDLGGGVERLPSDAGEPDLDPRVRRRGPAP